MCPLVPGWLFHGLAAAEPAWWCFAVTNPGWAAERDEIISLWPEDQLNAEIARRVAVDQWIEQFDAWMTLDGAGRGG
jgi:hypothetical protein